MNVSDKPALPLAGLRALAATFAVLLLLLSSLARAQAAVPSEQELRSRADEALGRGDHAATVAALEAIVEKHPESRDEQVFWDLGKVCDTYGFDFDKAIAAYRTYAARFPSGRFSARFAERLAYLESHRAEWEPLRRFTDVVTHQDTRPPEESIRLAEKVLVDFPSSSSRHAVHLWLATRLYKLERYEQARAHLDGYLACAPQEPAERGARTGALDLYVKTARKQHDFATALRMLERMEPADAVRAEERRAAMAEVRFERRAWWGFVASLACVGLATLATAAAAPWRRPRFGLEPRRLVRLLALVLAFTVGPAIVVRLLGDEMHAAFFALAGAGCVGLTLVALGSRASARIGRIAYVCLSLLLALALAYLALYVTGTAKVLAWPFEELGRHG